VSEFEDRQNEIDAAEAVNRHPKGWQPGVTWASDGGELVARAPAGMTIDDAFWELVIEDWGLDPLVTEIVPDSVQIRAWDMPLGGGGTMRAKYYKARIRPRRAAMTTLEQVELDKLVLRKRFRNKIKPLTLVATDPCAMIVNLSDFQIGKGEGGGTSAAIIRITNALWEARRRFQELRRCGRNIQTVYVIGLGDLAEQCFGNYPNQLWTTDRTRRKQLEIVRELITLAIDLFVDVAPYVVIGAVPGNHGENRKDGKVVTEVSDNDDLAVFDQVRESCAKNPNRYGTVEWHISDELVLLLDVYGVPVAWTHMHQGSGSGEKKITEWWKGQVMGSTPVARARILNTAHYHHFLMSESTGRTLLQVPAMDGGSGWWTAKTGQNSPAGLVTYLVGDSLNQRGWSDLAIHEGKSS
jgi:hypothetical protein